MSRRASFRRMGKHEDRAPNTVVEDGDGEVEGGHTQQRVVEGEDVLNRRIYMILD